MPLLGSQLDVFSWLEGVLLLGSNARVLPDYLQKYVKGKFLQSVRKGLELEQHVVRLCNGGTVATFDLSPTTSAAEYNFSFHCLWLAFVLPLLFRLRPISGLYTVQSGLPSANLF